MTKQVEAITELRRMTVAELDDHLSKQRRRLFEVRFQQATGQVENHRQVREIRHEIARALTVKIEIERGLRPELLLAAAATPAAPAKAAKPKPKPKAKAEPRLQVPAVVPAAVPVVESSEPEVEVADAADDQENVDD
ncbi:MAG TPA: 50S ribosomal protein L29 [Candidatus Saccharimonadales bacterium]|nr:50S ribosomal protein L29 [Candidatus Saccharimonadales bacterium]